MHYIPTTGWEDGTADLAKCLIDKLSAGTRVLWLVSGGSNIAASVKIMDCITAEHSQHLTVGLIDERYGDPGHADSNWQQLTTAGFDSKNARAIPILADGLSLQEAADAYNLELGEAWRSHGLVIMQLGMGPDGHIAGILPNSTACREEEKLVVGYEGPDFQRVTISSHAFEQKATAFVFVFGDNKKTAINNLYRKHLEVTEQPAQLLRQLPNVFIYSDQLGGNV